MNSYLCICVAAALCVLGLVLPGYAQDDSPAPYQIDKDRFIFGQIEDDAPFRTEENNPSEYEAYNTILLHARQFATADLERHARRDLTFKDLFLPVRREHRLELVYFEGRLRQLRRIEPTRILKDAGVHDLYEGWLFPRDEMNPICIVITELPPGLEPQTNLATDELDRWVSFAGYSFKLLQYESRQVNPRDPSRNVFRRAPVLLGRSVTLLPEPEPPPSSGWLTTFLPAALAGIGGIALTIVILTLYFRRGDRAVHSRVAARRDENPFLE